MSLVVGWPIVPIALERKCLGCHVYFQHRLFFRGLRTWRDPRHCINCSYNLTGNDSGRCPECGHPIGTHLIED